MKARYKALNGDELACYIAEVIGVAVYSGVLSMLRSNSSFGAGGEYPLFSWRLLEGAVEVKAFPLAELPLAVRQRVDGSGVCVLRPDELPDVEPIAVVRVELPDSALANMGTKPGSEPDRLRAYAGMLVMREEAMPGGGVQEVPFEIPGAAVSPLAAHRQLWATVKEMVPAPPQPELSAIPQPGGVVARPAFANMTEYKAAQTNGFPAGSRMNNYLPPSESEMEAVFAAKNTPPVSLSSPRLAELPPPMSEAAFNAMMNGSGENAE